MSETKFTPGRWRIWRDQDPKEPLFIEGMESDFICQLCMENTQAVANARLIAAAPELYDALCIAQATIERLKPADTQGRHGSAQGTLDVIHAVLAKLNS